MAIHSVKQKAVYIDLIEAALRLLPRMPQDVSLSVGRRLRRKGVKLFTDSAVQGVAADQLIVSGNPMKSHTVVWTAGITNHAFFSNNGFMLTPRGKVAPTSTWRLTTTYLWLAITPTHRIAGWRKPRCTTAHTSTSRSQ
jgi:NADH dehydrogenase FAD-containing subunit